MQSPASHEVLYGTGKPKAAYDRAVTALFIILAVMKALEDRFLPRWSHYCDQPSTYVEYYSLASFTGQLENRAV